MCRSRRELSNEYLLAKIGVDIAENELLARKSFAVAETQTDPGSPRKPGAAAARAPSPWRGLSEEPTWSAVADLVQSPPPALAPLKEPR